MERKKSTKGPRFKLVKGKIIRFIPERRLQIDCFKWLFYAHRSLIAFAIPNGGRRDLLEAVDLKRQGVKAGVPDIFIAKACTGYNGLFIELKTIDSKLSLKQADIIARLEKEGYYCCVCRTQKEFVDIVNWYIGNKEHAA